MSIPGFVLFFVGFCCLNSIGILPSSVTGLLAEAGHVILVMAITALGIKTSLKSVFELGFPHLLVVIVPTIFLLLAACGIVALR